MKEITEKILRYDPIYETEKMVKKNHWSEFDDLENMLSILMFTDHNKKKEEHLKSIGDTYHNIKWEDFKNLIKQHGFKEGLSYNFKHYDDSTKEEEAIIYYHPEKGLVIWATSYWNKKSVNGGKMYGMIQYNEDNSNDMWRVLNGCSNGTIEENYRNFDYDIREGLIHTINKIEEKFVFVNKWIKTPFLWFVDFTEEKQKGFDYKEITKNKIEKCPKELQEIIGFNK